MTYNIVENQTRTVWAEEFIELLTKRILDDLEKIETMPSDDLIKANGAISEIAEYVDQVQQQINYLGQAQDNYERLSGHEMGICPGSV